MVGGRIEVNGRLPRRQQEARLMAFRGKDRPTEHRHAGAKPGATREQVERRERFQRAQRESLKPDDDVTVLYGWHPVTAALNNPARRVRKLLATENAARRLAEEKVPTTPAPEIVRPG